MHLERKPDFDRTLARFEAWWTREIVDRPPVTIHVKPERAPSLPPAPSTLRERWMNVEYDIERFEATVTVTTYLGDHFPWYMPNVGPELTATIFGAELEFEETTSYSIPLARESCRQILAMKPDLDTPYWNNMRAKTDLSVARGRGRWLTALPDLHTNGDLVAALRNPQDMALDCALDLEGVRLACDYVNNISYRLMFDDLWGRIAPTGHPCMSWAPAPHASPTYPVSCDFICMVSPRVFQEAILPSIVGEMRFLGRSIFHLDGPGALRHLDALLDQPELHAVQWVYGANRGPATEWLEVYRSIQSRGRAIQLISDSLDDARAAAEALRPEGVWFTPQGVYSRADAEAFIAWTQRWAAGKA
jgi:hypothetical protein